MRKLVSILLLMSISAGGFTLGLGNIELSSGLNQSFDARIELLSPTSSELDSLNIRVADIEAFDRAGIEWLIILNSLSFEVEINDAGPDYIKISSREAIREPFLNFLLEASWSSGRLFREYTVLLDPPFYDPGERQITAPTAPLSDTTPENSISSSAGQVSSSTIQSSSISSFSGNEYGPVTSNDTLWAIANQLRPDSSMSVQQMMLALLRANPEAFIAGNINGLRQGQILRVPDQNETINISLDEALADVSSQNAMWEEVRGSFAGNAVQRPIGSSTQPSSDISSSPITADSELRLVAPSSQSTGVGQSDATFDTTGQGNADNILVNEQMEALSSENNDLRDRLEDSDVLIQDLRRLIELKDDELATIQQQVVGGEDQADDLLMGAGDQAVIDEEIDNADTDTEEEQIELVDEAITSLDLTETNEETPIPEPIESTNESEIPPAVSTTQTEPMAMDAGLVDQILRFVFGNMMLVGGAIGAIILGVLGFLFIRKRKGESADGDEIAAVTDFPDFESTAEETDMPESMSEMDVEADVENDGDADKKALIGDEESDQLSSEVSDTPVVEPAAVEEPEDDPLAEVNVFLAYEHFDQAEEFVRDAITNSPENLDFHSKLLEVFYSSGDKVKYE
ncbi:MAG: pilus assembly protein FimV, partial [Gammaproteobacteria bacterium]